MNQYLEQAKEKFNKIKEHLSAELASIRTGRAAPALVEQVRVEAYGTFTPLVELASIAAPEIRLLVIQPWDKSILKDIERALQTANLGVSPVVESNLIRINLPQLSEERRKELVKLVGRKLEEARTAVRNVREEILKSAKDNKTKGEITEDDLYKLQKEMQKLVDDINVAIKAVGDEKEKEVMTI